MGRNLSLQRYGYSVTWVGHGGLVSAQVLGVTQALLNWQGPPNFLMLHVGGNDIGCIKSLHLRHQLKYIVQCLRTLMPNTTIIWSSILPRLGWRYSNDTDAMERVRVRVNRALINYMRLTGGKAIRYPDFQDRASGLYSDNCHLSFIGNDIFLNSIQGALETFIHNPNIHIYPTE